jgi:DNA helicase-2/ATP-dependent DNA helicase PcrA
MPRAELDALLGLTLTDEQWDCVSAPLEPFVIVAGAGTGKTAVMAARVLWLVASGFVAEHEVLGLTFTNKAAAELAQRVTAQLNHWRAQHPADRTEAVGEPTIATYHSFAGRLIEEQGLRMGIEPGARLLSGPAVAQLAYRVVCRATGLLATRHGPSRVAADVVRLDANLAEQTITTDELRAHDRAVIAAIAELPKSTRAVKDIGDTATRRLELADLVDELRAAKRAVGGLDFADHMRLCAELVRSSDELVHSMRAAYRVVLLDEYQDTSIAQRVILSTLFAGGGVTAVGDPMQAIYGWRSASVANVDAFAQHFGRAGAAPVKVLSVNRRSGTPILEAANRIAAGLRAQHPQVAELRPPEPRGAVVRAALLPTVADEREWIADQVRALVDSGTPPEHIAILGRANDQLAPLQRLLVERGVPASISGTAALTSSPYATAVLSTLRVLDDAADNTSLAALLAGPRWRIGPRDLERLGARAVQLAGGRPGRGETDSIAGRARLRERLREASAFVDPVERASLLEAAANPGPGVSAEAADRLTELLAELRLLQAHVGAPLADLVGAVVTVTGARVEADLAAGGQGIGDVGLAGLLHLVEGFSDADGRTGLGAFLAYLDAAEQLSSGEDVDLPTMPGSVQLMTMHKAKGLEFPVVVLPHVCRDAFPGGKGSERWTSFAHVVPSELRDDRHVLPVLPGYSSKELATFVESCRRHDRTGDDRLAYVGVTRAKQVLIATGHWWGPTQKNARGPSEYLEALREQATGEIEDPWAPEPAVDPQEPADWDGGDGGGLGVADELSNPMLDQAVEVVWPAPDGPGDQGVVAAARAVSALVDSGQARDPWAQAGSDPVPGPAPTDPVSRQIAQWDAAILALLARTDRSAQDLVVATLPGVLSASATMDLAADPTSFAERLLRPMPRRRNQYAELGTAFHAWVEARLGVQPLIADDELPGAADESIGSPAELAAMKVAFERLEYAQRTPAGLEVPFSLAIAGRLIRGRIDAVFPAGPDAPPGQLWEVVDWKTSQHDVADPLQLAIYRLAWADLAAVPVEAVGAAFAFIRSGTVLRPAELLGAEELEALLAGEAEGVVDLGE